MDNQRYKEDLSEIRALMNKSTRFISLSGLSGVLAGMYALVGATLAHFRIRTFNTVSDNLYDQNEPLFLEQKLTNDLLLIAAAVVILALLTAILLSAKKAKANGENLWNPTSKRLLINFAIPLVSGGLFCLVLLQYGYVALIASATLIFYGLACLNASKYTLGDVRYLGIANIVVGLIATQFIGYGLFFWGLGFGVFHIFYGALMFYKYDKTA